MNGEHSDHAAAGKPPGGTTLGVFVTGTDTGVGKTAVAAAVLSVLRADGIDAVPMKPIQTGCRRAGADLAAPDLAFCLDTAGLAPSAEEERLMAPFRFEPACSPHLAAREAGQVLAPDGVAQAFTRLAARHQAVVVEGAGGILVPISGTAFMLDVMTALHLPVILVARPGLGTLNHTLLSLRELRRASLPVLGVVFCESSPCEHDAVAQDNESTIRELGRVPVLGCLPYVRGLDRAPGARAELRRRAAACLPPARQLLERMRAPCP
ncbi:MAG: dethiobiotin synthase [Kiritimatiellae bacterium]|nr:dethiobiotin synthase [Kiritimatiellia bacterium]